MRAVKEATAESTSVTGQQYSPGLEGIVAARTAMSDVNGRTGKLLYRGFDIAELAEKSNFEETCFLLYTGRLAQSLDEFRTAKALEPFSATTACWLASALATSTSPAASSSMTMHDVN